MSLARKTLWVSLANYAASPCAKAYLLGVIQPSNSPSLQDARSRSETFILKMVVAKVMVRPES